MNKDRLHIAVLGCGRIGKVHAQSIAENPRASLVAVADAIPAVAEALAAQHDAKVADIGTVMADTAIDAVIICTPTDTHQDIILKACKAGKAILCEKPIDMSVHAIETAKAAVETANVPFMTGFNRRFDPDFSALEQQLRDDNIGDIETVTITSRDPAPPPITYIESSGGIFRDMMIHDFDMARFLLGEEPTRIFATGSCLVDSAIGDAGDIDTATVILTTASGRQVQITNSRRASYGYDQRVEVHGSRGMLRVGNVLETGVEVADDKGFRRSPTQPFFIERYGQAYRVEMSAFVETVLDGKPASPGIGDGLKAQLLADAATASWKDGAPKSV